MNSERVYVGSLDVSKASQFLRVNVERFTDVALDYRARYNPTLGTWEATVKKVIGGTPQDLATPFKFTSSISASSEIDASAIAELEIQNSVAGTSGTVDVYLVGKSVG